MKSDEWDSQAPQFSGAVVQVCSLVRLVGSVHKLFYEALCNDGSHVCPLPHMRSVRRQSPPPVDNSELMRRFRAASRKHRLLEAAVDLVAPLTTPFSRSVAAYDAIGLLLSMSTFTYARKQPDRAQRHASGNSARSHDADKAAAYDSLRVRQWAVDALLTLTAALSSGSLQLRDTLPFGRFIGPLLAQVASTVGAGVVAGAQLEALARPDALPVLLQLYASGQPGWADPNAQAFLVRLFSIIGLPIVMPTRPSLRPRFTAKQYAENLRIAVQAAGRLAVLHQIVQLPPTAAKRAMRRAIAAGHLQVDFRDR